MKISKKCNLSDIAQELDVSIPTVSRALNGKEGVGERKRKQIIEYAEKAGYVSKQSSAESNIGLNKIIAIILGDIRNPFYTDLVFHMQKELSENGYMTMIFNNEYDLEREKSLLKMVQDFRFAGLILITALAEAAEETVNAINMPMVLVNRIVPSYTGDSVLMDNFQAGYMAVTHLVELNHQHIGFIKGPSASDSSTQRYNGFCQALQVYHLNLDVNFIFSSNLNVDSGRAVAKEFLQNEEPRPSAMVIVNDLTALGFIDECRKNKLKIPEDISIVSFDDIWCAALEGIALTTVNQHVEEMASHASRLILKQLKGETQNPERIILPPTLIKRNSSARRE